jgi:hypothetical protein
LWTIEDGEVVEEIITHTGSKRKESRSKNRKQPLHRKLAGQPYLPQPGQRKRHPTSKRYYRFTGYRKTTKDLIPIQRI